MSRRRKRPSKRGATETASVQAGRKVGLARALSKLGFCSRSAASQLICAGRVSLNGVAKRNPETAVHIGQDRIEVDGRAIEMAPKIYLVLNKPPGC